MWKISSRWFAKQFEGHRDGFKVKSRTTMVTPARRSVRMSRANLNGVISARMTLIRTQIEMPRTTMMMWTAAPADRQAPEYGSPGL